MVVWAWIVPANFPGQFSSDSQPVRGGFADDSEPSKLGAGGKENRARGSRTIFPRIVRNSTSRLHRRAKLKSAGCLLNAQVSRCPTRRVWDSGTQCSGAAFF